MSESDSLTAHSDMNDFTLKSHNSFQSDYGMDFGLPRDVLETMTDFSVSSPGMLSEEMRALEDEFRDEISLLNESPVSAKSARLQALATRQRDRLVNAELDIAAYCAHQTVAENVNGNLSERLAGLSTAHVLVCLERDELRRFKQLAKPLLAVLIIVILLGLVGYLGHFFGV